MKTVLYSLSIFFTSEQFPSFYTNWLLQRMQFVMIKRGIRMPKPAATNCL